jgi:type III pantothenate kinase
LFLCVDVGNTNTVFAVFENSQLVAQWRTVTVAYRTADQYFVWLQQLMRHKSIIGEDIKGGIISSVVPQTIYNLRQLFQIYFGSEPYVVGSKNCPIGIDVFLDTPSEVGADRLVNAVAGYKQYGADLVIVDFGTATTFDVVGENGSYHGGVIAPGINLSVKALQDAAARLPTIEIDIPPSVIAKNTVHAMQSGIYWGYISLIEGICARIQSEWNKPMKVIATGGLCTLFAKGTSYIEITDQNLTIMGLSYIYEKQDPMGFSG